MLNFTLSSGAVPAAGGQREAKPFTYINFMRFHKQTFAGIMLWAFMSACISRTTNTEDKKRVKTGSRIDTLYDSDGHLGQILSIKDGKLNGVSKVFYPSGRIKSLKFFKDDTTRGVIKRFFENGYLQKISYAINDSTNIYYREYGPDGSLLREEGTPFIKSIVDESRTHDTFYLQANICNCGFKNLKVEISPDANHYREFELAKTNEADLMELKAWKPLRDLVHFSFYIRTTGVDEWNNKRIYNDTLSFQQSH